MSTLPQPSFAPEVVGTANGAEVGASPGSSPHALPDHRARRAAATGTAVTVASCWMPAVAASMFYPIAVVLFVEAIHAAGRGAGATHLLFDFAALCMLAVAAAAPGLAVRGLFVLRQRQGAGVALARRLLHVACAVPPIYVLSMRIPGAVSTPFGALALNVAVWWCGWVALGVWVWRAGRQRADAVDVVATDAGIRATAGASTAVGDGARGLSGLMGVRSRRVHRVVVVAILLAFLVVHLFNHLTAVWSLPAQQAVMHALRLWYRSIWVEPIILALFVAAAFTGLMRLARLTDARADGFRVLQTASGAYIAFFLVSHIWATLGARYHDVDPNWAFATGGQGGMLANSGIAAVFLYYTFALVAVSVHAGLGARMVMLARHARAAAADRTARVVMGCGSVLSALIVAALLGVRLG